MSPENMKFFLDELAILSAKHKIEIIVKFGRLAYVPLSSWFEAYEAFDTEPFGGGQVWAEGRCPRTDCVTSVDPSKLSNHEILQISGRKP